MADFSLPSRGGMALIEVIVAIAILALGLAAVFSALARASAITSASAQRLAAGFACSDAIELFRSKPYSELRAGNSTNTTEILLYGVSTGDPTALKAERKVIITEAEDGSRADIRVDICWNFRGKEYRQSMFSSRYRTEAEEGPIVLGGSVAGVININPNNSPDNEFELETASGSVITAKDLGISYAGYSGVAVRMTVRPKGNGKQNGLVYNGQPFVFENRMRCEIISENMSVNLYNDKIDKKGRAMGHWWIEVNAEKANLKVTN